jgi:hypothetical protein
MKSMRSLFLRLRTLLSLLLFTACGTLPSTLPATPTAAATPTATATLMPILPPTQTATPMPQAFFCVNVATPTPVAGCIIPTAQERDRFCVGKSPYTLIAIPANETYQVLTPNFNCTDNGIRNNNHILSCTGPQSYGFQIKVCQSACAISLTQSGASGYCAPGFNYDSTNQCCMIPAADSNGCIVLSFGTRACGK